MADAIRVGMVGYGEMGRRQALAWQALALSGDGPGPVRLMGVAAPAAEATKAREDANFAFATDDPEEVIGHPEVDIVVVCATPNERAPVLRSALASGKHVLCAPPLAGNLRDSEEIAALAGRIPGQRQMISDWRWLPVVLRAREVIQNGRIGELQMFRMTCRRALPVASAEDETRVAGTVLYGLLPHALDVARALNGDVAEVNALVEAMLDPQAQSPSPTRKVVIALLRFVNGSIGILEASCAHDGPEDSCRVEVSGSNGGVSFDVSRSDALTLRGAAGAEAFDTEGIILPAGRLGGEVACLRAFLRSVGHNDPTAPTFRDGLMAQRAIEAICASAEEGAWRAVDLGR